MMTRILSFLVALLIISSCGQTATQEPTISDYELGEKWIWKWERAVDGEIRAEGKDLQEVVDYQGELGFWNGMDTVLISSTIGQNTSDTPFRAWPLEVGKKWKYENTWSNDEGTTGTTSQDVEVVAYEEITVVAGTFKAYKIEYKGLVTNSRGFRGDMKDTWWYCPELKTYIKHLNEDGYGLYVNELISYSKSS